ncbi:MAG: PqqD family protein [Bacteroidales bacterium]|nr:PqqD family protein [Bacteroidales bacterium]
MGNRYIIVSTDADSVNMADVFTLNESAALLWERAASAESFDENICEVLVENYGIDRETALRDTLSTLSQWKEYGLVTE